LLVEGGEEGGREGGRVGGREGGREGGRKERGGVHTLWESEGPVETRREEGEEEEVEAG
jgi:hypothetical protein